MQEVVLSAGCGGGVVEEVVVASEVGVEVVVGETPGEAEPA